LPEEQPRFSFFDYEENMLEGKCCGESSSEYCFEMVPFSPQNMLLVFQKRILERELYSENMKPSALSITKQGDLKYI